MPPRRVATASESRARDELIPRVAARGLVPARKHPRGSRRIALKEKRSDARKRVLVLRHLRFLRAIHRVFECDILASLHETDQGSFASPIESGARVARFELKDAAELGF